MALPPAGADLREALKPGDCGLDMLQKELVSAR